MTPVPPPPHLRRNDSQGALNVVRPPLRPPLLRRIDSRTSLNPGSFQQPRPVRPPFIRPPFNGTPPRPPEPGFRPFPPGIRPPPRLYLAQPPSRDGVVTSVEGGVVGVEASKLQQQVYLNNNDQKILDPEHKQNILSFVKTGIRNMEHQNQSEDFDRPVSRTGGDMFSVNGHFNGNETHMKSPEPQKAPSAPAKIPPVAPLEQKVPVPTQSAPSAPRNPQPFEAKVPSVLPADLNRPPLATHSVVGPEVQRSTSAVSKADAGEFHKIPSATSSVISEQPQMPQSAPSSVNSAENERPVAGARSVIAADIECPQPVAQKPESSKVMNGVAVKPAEGIKKEEDDDNDVIIMRSPGTLSSSSEEVVVEGKTRGAATDEAQRAGKSLFLESQFADNLRLETKANTVADTEDSAKKQKLEYFEGKEDALKKIDGKNGSEKEWKSKEDKEEEESQKKEYLKDELMRSTESLKDSWKKEPGKIDEKSAVSPSKQIEKETAKDNESLTTAPTVTSQPAEMKDSKPGDRTEEKTCKDTEQVTKEIPLKSEKSVKEGGEKADDRKEVVFSNNEVHVTEQKAVSPKSIPEISKKESVKVAEKEIEIKEGFKKEETKTEDSSNLQGNDSVRTGYLPSVDDDVIRKGSAQQQEDSKDEALGESYKKLIEGTDKGSPKKEETKETERREDSLTNETKTLEKSPKEKEEEAMKEWPKKEDGGDIKKVEDSSKKEVEELKGFAKKENETGSFSATKERELLEGKAETLIAKEEQTLKDEVEDVQKKKEEVEDVQKKKEEIEVVQKKKEEIEIVKKAELIKKEKTSTKVTEGPPKEKKSENISSSGVEKGLPRPGGVSPALSKPTRPKSKSSTVSESTASRETSSTGERPTSGPKEMTATITPEPEVEKSPRTKTPKDLGESKPKKRAVKKRDSQSLDEVAKKQGNDTAASTTIMTYLLVDDVFYV